jgi:hypothetical protein
MMHIGVKVAYDEEGRPEERYFTIRFWRLEFRFELSLQPALDEQAAFERGDFQAERDPIAAALAAELQRSLFAVPLTPFDMHENIGLLELLRRSEGACACVEEKTFAGTRTILCRQPGCRNVPK